MFTPRRSAEKSARTRISASSSHTSMPPQAPSQTFVKASRPAIVWSHVKIVSLKTWIVSGRVAQILLVKWTKMLSMVCLESSQNLIVKSCASKLITAPGTHFSSPTPAISMTSASSWQNYSHQLRPLTPPSVDPVIVHKNPVLCWRMVSVTRR